MSGGVAPAGGGGGMSVGSKIIMLIVGLIVLGGILVGVIFGIAATKTCTKNDDCLKVLGYEKCFIDKKKDPAATAGVCARCGTNGDCAGDTPYCVNGACVAKMDGGCATDTDCPTAAGSNKCFVATKTCGQCAVHADCSGATPYCVGGTCSATAPADFQCSSDVDCPTSAAPHCSNGACGQCAVDDHCPQTTPFCLGGKCVATNCTLSTDCATTAPGKPYCINGVCNATCRADSQCTGAGQKCVAGSCKTPCTQANKSTQCTGSNLFCGADGYCTNTNCGADTDCTDVLKPQCKKAAGATSGVCSARSCSTNYDCSNIFDATSTGLRCASGTCSSCNASVPCGKGFSCVDGRCVFDPAAQTTGGVWSFYPAVRNVYSLGLYNDPRYPQDSTWFVDELLNKADGDGVNIILIYGFNATTNKARAKFFLPQAGSGWSMGPSMPAPYQWSATSTLKSPNGLYLSKVRNITAPPAGTVPPKWAMASGATKGSGFAVKTTVKAAPAYTVTGKNTNLDQLKAYAVANNVDAFSIGANNVVTWFDITQAGWDTAADAATTLHVNLATAPAGGSLPASVKFSAT